MFRVSENDLLSCIAAESCEGFYEKGDILQATRELADKYGNLDFNADELTRLIHKKNPPAMTDPLVASLLPIVDDLGHKGDGTHIIELRGCGDCDKGGTTPVVRWMAPLHRNNTQ